MKESRSLNNSRVYQKTTRARAPARCWHSVAAANFYGPFITFAVLHGHFCPQRHGFSLFTGFFFVSHCASLFLFFLIFASYSVCFLLAKLCRSRRHIFHGIESLTCENFSILFMDFLAALFFLFHRSRRVSMFHAQLSKVLWRVSKYFR